MFANVFRDSKVWISGHTGFKGAWLAEWLLELGAKVHGFALPPATMPALFDQLNLGARIEHEIGDVRDGEAVHRSILTSQPDFVFHLAAQALVRQSYKQPVDTYSTNVMGSIHVMEALRRLSKPCAALFVTTDKCYENRETSHAYAETDRLGGHDPYSSSKAAAEIAIASWRRSFFKDHPVRIASARAGNVIGGGDWAADRILPDSIRALQAGLGVPVRNPRAVRPWQHVLEPLSGYLWLAAQLAQAPCGESPLASAFNFGPGHGANRPVAALVAEVLKHWPGRWEDRSNPKSAHEAGILQLSIDKAYALLQWAPVWSFETAIDKAVGWYRDTTDSASAPLAARSLTLAQIASYTMCAREANLPWAASAPCE